MRVGHLLLRHTHFCHRPNQDRQVPLTNQNLNSHRGTWQGELTKLILAPGRAWNSDQAWNGDQVKQVFPHKADDGTAKADAKVLGPVQAAGRGNSVAESLGYPT